MRKGFFFKYNMQGMGTGEMAQRLIALAAFPEDAGIITWTHTESHNMMQRKYSHIKIIKSDAYIYTYMK